MGLFRFKKGRCLIGLDIGSSAVKAVEFTDHGDRLAVTAYNQKPLESKEAAADIVRECIIDGNFHTRDVATSVSGRGVVVRFVNMMKMSQEELEKAVQFEADKYIPFELSDVVLASQKLEEIKDPTMSEREMKVLLVAVKKETIEEHIDILRKAGLNPQIIDVDAFALSNAFEMKELLGPKMAASDKVDALVDIGSNKTNISIVKNMALRFSREFYIAGNDFTDAVAKRLQMDLQEAEAVKANPAGREQEVEEAVRQLIEDFANEIHLSSDYYESKYEEEVDEIYLSGGGAKLYGLAQSLEQIFGKRVSLWDPFEGYDVDTSNVNTDALARNAPRLVIAAGLAARIRGG
ncbi:MAG: type IV pilus assembly protein PilM [Planctomycetota bacterium]|nr:type IV pilus assembly protein PilM [Planctomycetota bacterium]